MGNLHDDILKYVEELGVENRTIATQAVNKQNRK
jgi:hypothetical protein